MTETRARAKARATPLAGLPPRERALRSERTEALAVAAQGGDRGAFDALVLRLEGALVRFLCVRTGSRADAEELAQEAFLRAWSALARFDSQWRFTTWLYAIASRLATSHARRLRPQQGEATLSALAGGGDPAHNAGEREARAGLWDLAARVLSPDERAALWLRYADDLSAEEIGRVLGRRAVSVRVLLFRARERLARHLDPSSLEDATTPAPLPANSILGRRSSGSPTAANPL